MKISQRGFIIPLLLVIAVLLLTGGAYVYIQNKQTSQSSESAATQATSTPQTISARNTDWHVYHNSKYGFSLTFPDTWKGYRIEESASAISVGIKDQQDIFIISAIKKPEWYKMQKEADQYGGPLPNLITEDADYAFVYSSAQDFTDAVIDLARMRHTIVSTFTLDNPEKITPLEKLTPMQSNATMSLFKVGMSGGILISPDGKMTFQIPQGALIADAVIKYTNGSIDPVGTSLLTFLKPAIATLSYDPSFVKGEDERSLSLNMYDSFDSSVDIVKHVLTAKVNSIRTCQIPLQEEALQPIQTPTANASVFMVTRRGGVLVSPDKKVQIEIPEGVVQTEINITIGLVNSVLVHNI